jgi:hypothetical protein
VTGNPTASWRHVFNEELLEIKNQRKIRHFVDPSLSPQNSSDNDDLPPGPAGPPKVKAPKKYPAGWSRRLLTGEAPLNLIGLVTCRRVNVTDSANI